MSTPSNLVPRVNEIMEADLPEIDKLAQAYGYIIQQHIDVIRRECEKFKELGDKDALVKMQVQLSTMEYMLGVFLYCHRQVLWKRVPVGIHQSSEGAQTLSLGEVEDEANRKKP